MELQDKKSRAVANWLILGVAMTIVQIALGGITRLTGSGLSITEWDVVTGTLPPLNQAAWLALFEKYKTTPQFQLLNFDFTIDNFKFIFFWEWFHRLWARTIGLVFAFGFIYFIVKKYFQPSMIRPLVVLFLLGALQGAIGWIMVASGLEGDAVYVKPTRLALHFIFVDAANNVEKLDQGIAKYHGVRPVEVIQEEIKFIFEKKFTYKYFTYFFNGNFRSYEWCSNSRV